MKYCLSILMLLASLTISSVLQAQYRWHIIHPNQIDTFLYYFDQVSCTGNNYSAAGAKFNYASTSNEYLIAHSSDAGATWSYCSLPKNPWEAPYVFHDMQQIDSLHAVSVGYPGMIYSTNDGWQIGNRDSAEYGDAGSPGEYSDHHYYKVDFANATEGIISGFGLCWTTDGGSIWNVFDSAGDKGYGAVHAYGNGMFCTVMSQPGYLPIGPDLRAMILTTGDYWVTTDTSLIEYNGPLSDTTVIHYFFFGNGDTLFCACLPDDTGDRGLVTLSVSSDLGSHWSAVPIPEIGKIPDFKATPFTGDTIVFWSSGTAGLLVISTDHGRTWAADSVPAPEVILSNPFYRIFSVSLGAGGRIVASIFDHGDSAKYGGSGILAYLEPRPSSVQTTLDVQPRLIVYPNPVTDDLNLDSSIGNISILDPLGRNYEVKRSGSMVNASSLPSGVYFISDGPSRAKFVKE